MAPSTAVADQLDLLLALQRVKQDIKLNRTFFVHPFELRLVQIDEQQWLSQLAASVAAGTYVPHPQQICAVPKPKGHVRPGGWLRLEDQVYYSALVGACLPAIVKAISDRRGPLDFSYRLNQKTTAKEWLHNPFVGWERFRVASLEKIAHGAAYVVSVDLAGYYETIGHQRLLADLRQYGVSNDLTSALNECLRTWAQIRGRGIPQGFSASDILGKLYLSEVDLAFAEMGYDHFRYVDDFRIFCSSRSHARRALASLSRLIRPRGLVFQAAKTSVLPATEAADIIDGVPQKIRSIKEEYLREILAAGGHVEGYFSIAAADEVLAELGESAPTEVLERAYDEYLLSGKYTFDKTIFHFLLRRLGRGGSRYAVEHTIAMLTERPDETKHVIRYWRDIGLSAELDEAVATFLGSEEAVYAYQRYELLEWRGSLENAPPGSFLTQVRRACFSGRSPFYLRATARQFLSRFGSHADLSRIKDQYTHTASELERAEVMCCIARLEPAIRNEFYTLASRDGEYPQRAERAVKTGLIS